MSYRSLLVLLDHEPSCEARTATAARLAMTLGAHLIGLAPTDLLDLPVAPPAASSLNACAALVWDALRDQAEGAADRFGDQCHAAGLRSFEAIVDEAAKAESVRRHARYCDLVILSQADPDAPDRAAAGSLVDRVVLQGARPSLVLPHKLRSATLGQRVLLAWNGSREAARAASDAMPILQRAERVEAVTWQELPVAKGTHAERELEALQAWLARHGVSASVRVERVTRPAGECLAASAVDSDADLIVMGAYGHGRLLETVLGGATRQVLRHTSVPVLMSH